MSEKSSTALDPTEQAELLLRDLRSSRSGLSEREAERRLARYGPNRLKRRSGRHWPKELARQFAHPLALLLWAAAVLAWAAGITPVAIAIVIVVVINAAFAFVQEIQAERAVEALEAYLPAQAKVIRDGHQQLTAAELLTPGDVLVIEEGDRISADARLLKGSLEIDLSTLTGESSPAFRAATFTDTHVPILQARELVFSGTTCTEGKAQAVVFATGMRTELGRIAALSEQVEREESPLEKQIRKVAWLIALIAVLLGAAFVPFATLGAELPIEDAIVFAVGILVGNVPEGLLPVITLALAVGVRELVRRGAVVKRLSAVETLGSTSVICTDKTGTLTENRMRVETIWTPRQIMRFDHRGNPHKTQAMSKTLRAVVRTMAACNSAELEENGRSSGDPTEVAMLKAASALNEPTDSRERERRQYRRFHFDPKLKMMSTVDKRNGDLYVNAKGAPEAILSRCTTVTADGENTQTLDKKQLSKLGETVDSYARNGLRVLAVANRKLNHPEKIPGRREQAERNLTLLGLIALLDPPRPEIADAVARCHTAGIRIIMLTGDHPQTAQAVARQTGITRQPTSTVVLGEEADELSDTQLAQLLRENDELMFARTSPETKLRIADALSDEGHVVAMTGDGVNDAPALRRADIGIAMGRSGTDVAREASTMVLSDDNFATIVTAVQEGRRIYDNIRKFILYIFTHTTPEVTPFIVFALAGGAIPLPLNVLQLLAIDIGTETLPALALGREPAEKDLMHRPPRKPTEGVINRAMLLRAWLFLGGISAALAMAGFFYVLLKAGWHPGDPTGPRHPLHHAYQQATTMTFFGLVAGQVGTAFAARTERTSLKSIGILSNKLLLWGIAFELLLTAFFIYAPPFQALLGTAPLTLDMIAFAAPFPLIIWGADELRRRNLRRAKDRTA